MTSIVNDVTPRAHYTATASQTTFTVPFLFVNNTDLKVYKNGTLMTYDATPADNTEYSTTGEDNPAGGSIVFGSPGLDVGDLVVIIRDIPIERTAQYSTTKIPISTLNDDLSRIMTMMQELETDIETRTLRIPAYDTPEAFSELPVAASRANKYLKFDANGDIAVDDSLDAATVQGDILPSGDGLWDIGASGLRFAEIWGGSLDISGNITVGGSVDGRDVAADGIKLDGIEAGADVTDPTNVAAAGAIMDSDFGSNGIMTRIGAGNYGTAVADTDYQSVPAEGAFASGDKTKLDGIETGADVTDGSNVAAAGAIMDTDFSSNGLMKRTGAGTYDTAAADVDYQTVPSEGPFVNGDKTALDAAILNDGTNVGAITVPVAGDYLVFIDATDGLFKKVDWDDLPSGGGGGDAWSDPVDAVITPDADGTRDLAATLTRFATGYLDALDITNNIVVGGTVDGRDLATDGTKLDGIEAAADVTDATNVAAAGAMMLDGSNVPATVTGVSGDFVLISDTSDAGALKKVTWDSVGGGGGGDLWTDPIDGNITVALDNTYSIGAENLELADIWSAGMIYIHEMQHNDSAATIYLRANNNNWGWSDGAHWIFEIDANIGSMSDADHMIRMANDVALGWASGNTLSTGTMDTQMHRDAAGIVAFRHNTNAQGIRVYYTDDGTQTNYERAMMEYGTGTTIVENVADVLKIGQNKGGTGASKIIEFHTGGGTGSSNIAQLALTTTGTSALLYGGRDNGNYGGGIQFGDDAMTIFGGDAPGGLPSSNGDYPLITLKGDDDPDNYIILEAWRNVDAGTQKGIVALGLNSSIAGMQSVLQADYNTARNREGYDLIVRGGNAGDSDATPRAGGDLLLRGGEPYSGGDGGAVQIGDATTGSIEMHLGILMNEQADHTNTPAAAHGEVWLKNNAPNVLVFTDDAGTDFPISPSVYGITDGAAFEIDPANGQIQTITLGANRTPKGTNFVAGQSVTLHIDDGTAYTLTWTDTTFGTSGVTWVGGTAPTLATSGYTVVTLWKVGSQVYGSHVGDVA